MSETSAPPAALPSDSPPPAPMPARPPAADPRQQLHKLAEDLIRVHNRKLLTDYLRLRRTLR
jgi:hypothetical protein